MSLNMRSATRPSEEGQPMDEETSPSMTREFDRKMSIDTSEDFHPPRAEAPPLARPPISPYSRYSAQTGQNIQYPEMQTRLMSQPLQSVVTASFSAEERDGFRVHGAKGKQMYVSEQRYDREERYIDDGERDDWGSPGRGGHQKPPPFASTESRDMGPPPPPPPLPHRSRTGPPITLQRAYSSPGYYAQSQSMKRNYYHHSQPSEFSRELPSEFMPPKRSKLNPSHEKEKIVPPSTPRHAGPGEWYPRSRSGTWDSAESNYKYIGRAHSFPVPPSWNPYSQPTSPSASLNRSPAMTPRSDVDSSPRRWQPPSQHQWSGIHSPQSAWTSPKATSSEHPWDTPRRNFHYNDTATSLGKMSYEVERQGHFDHHPSTASGPGKMGVVADAASEARNDSPASKGSNEDNVCKLEMESGETIILLASPQDRISLSETLCVVRENIEVFTATQQDVDAPAPGRKHAVVVGQVGLRCIHCRHTTRCSDRVKRAVCYPSSIKRIYRTVIDMKLDHFSQCKFVPASLKQKLDELKAVHTRSTGTTMQYFIRSAQKLGMTDGPSGVHFASKPDIKGSDKGSQSTETIPDIPAVTEQRTSSNLSSSSISDAASSSHNTMMSTESFDTAGSREGHQPSSTGGKFFEGIIPLALAEDKTALSPLRCFLREHVCAFSATEEDIAVRAPTTFSIKVGQVGIGCIHCVKQAAKLRSNRAVCFPFSIGRIYQSVADIQRFHLSECKMLPPDVKAKFVALQNASSKGSKGLATRQYWVTSAKKLGLVDTPNGIRFGRDPSQPSSAKAFSLDILAQVAFSVTTANKQLVVPEDKEHIAEFLYVVMEQLQPCRFTEADRNKRRLKDVGCIGVECKHCAGQVDGRKFFWSSVSAVESNFVSVHTHMLECRMVPPELKARLVELKKLRKEQTAALRTGSQKAFFARVWERLHTDEQKIEDDVSDTNEQFPGKEATASSDASEVISV